MAAFMKKQSTGFFLNLIAAILGLVGIIAAAVCSSMTVTYSLGNMKTIVILGICGMVLSCAAICLPNVFGNQDYLGTLAVLGSIAVFTAAFGSVLSERILLIAGLFSYDAVNTVGWQVFYVTVVSLASFLLAAIIQIIGAFTNSVKTLEEEK